MKKSTKTRVVNGCAHKWAKVTLEYGEDAFKYHQCLVCQKYGKVLPCKIEITLA